MWSLCEGDWVKALPNQNRVVGYIVVNVQQGTLKGVVLVSKCSSFYISCRDGSEVGDCRVIWCNYSTGISQQRSGPDSHGHSNWAASSKEGVY